MRHSGFDRPNALVAVLWLGLCCISLHSANAQSTSDPNKCMRQMRKGLQKLEQFRMLGYRLCEDKKLSGALPAITDCTTDPFGKFSKGEQLITGFIEKACCGNDKECDDGPGVDKFSDLDLEDAGWAPKCVGGDNDGESCDSDADCAAGGGNCTATCPDLQGAGCNNDIDGFDDVITCAICERNAAVDNLNTSFYGSILPTASDDNKLKNCKREIGKRAALYFFKQGLFNSKCDDGLLKTAKLRDKGKYHKGKTFFCPDPTFGGKIDDQRAKALELIAKKCGGVDKEFGGGDDFTLGEIGAPANCATLFKAGTGTSCGDALSTVEDLANCNVCLTDGNELLSDGNHCGDGIVDPNVGETCDDGDNLNNNCPADCIVRTCEQIQQCVGGNAPGKACGSSKECPGGGICEVVAPAPTQTVRIAFDGNGNDISGLTIRLEYQDGVVNIPGSGNQASVSDRVTLIPGGLFNSVNDLNYALRTITFDPFIGAIPEGDLYDLSIDQCIGADQLTSGNYNCVVEDAQDTTPAPVAGVTCTATFQ